MTVIRLSQERERRSSVCEAATVCAGIPEFPVAALSVPVELGVDTSGLQSIGFFFSCQRRRLSRCNLTLVYEECSPDPDKPSSQLHDPHDFAESKKRYKTVSC